jgi:predicted acylesterase/phospholipase RssA
MLKKVMVNMIEKTALVLAGGGLAGTVYELGALRAIDALLVNRTVNDFDIFVGTSAGAIVAAGLANGLDAATMLQAIEGVHPKLAPFRQRDLFRVNKSGVLQRVVTFPTNVRKVINHYWQNPSDITMFDVAWELSSAFPPALYDGLALESYIRALLNRSGVHNRFTALERELYVIATNLESGQRVVFGEPPYDRVSISQAIAASSAVPVLYRPVRIGNEEFVDGCLRGNASLDVAIERGAKLIVCVNPLVPYDNSADPDTRQNSGFLSDQGMQVVINQVLRITMHSGLHYHIKQLRRQHPDVDIILIEPKRDDWPMMRASVMRYSSRRTLARHGYESVAIDLSEDYHYFKAILARHDIDITRKRILPELNALRKPEVKHSRIHQLVAGMQTVLGG